MSTNNLVRAHPVGTWCHRSWVGVFSAGLLMVSMASDTRADEDKNALDAAGEGSAIEPERSCSATVPIGETVPYDVDSGRHDGDPEGVRLVFTHVVQREGASWIRLHFDQVALGPEDYIEVRSLEHGSSQVLRQEDIALGRLASAYFDGSAVEVGLFVGPTGRKSGFVISSIGVGFAQAPPPNQGICDSDQRVISNDDRVCMLSSKQKYCSGKIFVKCGCPGPGASCPVTAGDDTCSGGTRNGKPCGNDACKTDGPCVLGERYATAFFIEGGPPGQRCLLTVGHHFYNGGENFQQNGNFSTTLHCRVYGCGPGNTCDNARNGVGQCSSGSARAGQHCVTGTSAAPNEQYPVTLVDGEFSEDAFRHDWALVTVGCNAGPSSAFALTKVWSPGKNLVHLIGHGQDTNTAANTRKQQKDYDRARRPPPPPTNATSSRTVPMLNPVALDLPSSSLERRGAST